MKVSELRIGNWINSNSTQLDWEVNASDFEHITDNPDHYKPIQLTEEWLLKFGFVKYTDIFSTEEKSYTIDSLEFQVRYYKSAIDGVDYNIILYRDLDTQIKLIKYVHQLQNLYFALTGKELETS